MTILCFSGQIYPFWQVRLPSAREISYY